MAVTVFSPLAELINLSDNSLYTYRSLGIFQDSATYKYSTMGVISMCIIGAAIALITIFFYKKRKVQLKLCYTNIIAILLFYGAFFSYYYAAKNSMNIEFSSLNFGIILPIVALIFNILATSKIKADEKLIRSLDRIR